MVFLNKNIEIINTFNKKRFLCEKEMYMLACMEECCLFVLIAPMYAIVLHK